MARASAQLSGLYSNTSHRALQAPLPTRKRADMGWVGAGHAHGTLTLTESSLGARSPLRRELAEARDGPLD